MDEGCPRNSLGRMLPQPYSGKVPAGSFRGRGRLLLQHAVWRKRGGLWWDRAELVGGPLSLGSTNNFPAQEKNELHSAHWAPPTFGSRGLRVDKGRRRDKNNLNILGRSKLNFSKLSRS